MVVGNKCLVFINQPVELKKQWSRSSSQDAVTILDLLPRGLYQMTSAQTHKVEIPRETKSHQSTEADKGKQ